MGLLSNLLGMLTGNSLSRRQNNPLLDSILGMITGSGGSGGGGGGISGLLDIFKSKGLGDIFSSWIGTGKNQKITPNQVQEVLGSDQIAEIAAKLGIGQKKAAGGIAKMLPQVIDKLTPQGSIPDHDGAVGGLDAIKKLLGF